MTQEKCPRCDSPAPKLHPAMQFEGEVSPCSHEFHGEFAALTKREADTRRKLASMCETVVRVFLDLELLAEASDSRDGAALKQAARVLRAAVLAAT